MSINFAEVKCQGTTKKKLFGLCDDPSPSNNPAYIDEKNGAKWIAVVNNETPYEVTFTAIDNCIGLNQKKGNIYNSQMDIIILTGLTLLKKLKSRGICASFFIIISPQNLI